MNPTDLVIAVDTREQQPYRFPRQEVVTLQTGDYSIIGLEDQVAVERKTKEDAFSSLGRDRDRFEREVGRLSRFNYAAIVIESSLQYFLQRPAFSCMNPKAALNSLIAWSVRYRINVFFAGDRRHGSALTRRILEMYFKSQEVKYGYHNCRKMEDLQTGSDRQDQ